MRTEKKCQDMFNRLSDVGASAAKPGKEEAVSPSPELEEVTTTKREPQPIWVIFGLTAFRFSTGFESGTWLPYLLAMEGAELWHDNQALFMALAKLIYGVAILLTPLLGLLGDRLAMQSHALSRRLFMRCGMLMAAVGMFVCHWSAPRGHFFAFGWGVLIWRFGQGLNDVTTEAICPELLPPEQFQISSSIRAMMFLVGALTGYVLVLFLQVHYSWLYHGYLIAMFVCGLPSLLIINKDMPRFANRGSERGTGNFLKSCIDAYIKPSRFQGGFPMACLCVFIFGCCTAPMFFFCLFIRDLVGITDQAKLQKHFGLISILFFLSAALASVLNALIAPKKGNPHGKDRSSSSTPDIRAGSFKMTAAAIISFGLFVFFLPFVHSFGSEVGRLEAFYVMAGITGFFFGSAYARFQDCMWQLLPANVNTANAMGFCTLTRLFGGALGNVVAGFVLDLVRNSSQNDPNTQPVDSMGLIAYSPAGYFVVCTGCTVLSLISGALILRIPARALQAQADEAASKDAASKVPAKEEPQVPPVSGEAVPAPAA
jgi:MFS family permease